jgi:hypothetical protein
MQVNVKQVKALKVMQVNVKQVKAQRHQIYPMVQLPTKAGLRLRCWGKPQRLWDLFQSAPPSHLSPRQ